jgi:hypothetical protein
MYIFSYAVFYKNADEDQIGQSTGCINCVKKWIATEWVQ